MSKNRDTINILKHLSLPRMFNLIGLGSSYKLSRLSTGKFQFGKPFSLSIEPTTACNLGCPECPSGLKQFSRATGKLNIELNAKILREVAGHVFYINYYFQGEPFLHPDFLELIKQAKKHRIYTATSTNAHFIDEKKAEEIVKSGLDRLIISIDGITQKNYEQYRVHGDLSKVISGTEHLVKAKKRLNSSTPHLIFQCLAVKPNEDEIPAIINLGHEIGVDEVRIKTAQLYDYKHGNPLMPSNEEYSRYKLQKDGTYSLKYKTGNNCWGMWSGSVITWDGKVVPCCFDKDAVHQLGDLSTSTFSEVWKNKKYQIFRQNVFTSRNSVDICQNCSEGSKVWT